MSRHHQFGLIFSFAGLSPRRLQRRSNESSLRVLAPGEDYFASRHVATEDARGVPLELQKASTAAALAKTLPLVDAGAGGQPTKVSYVIERMCVNPGPVTPANCNRLPPKGVTGDTANDPALIPPPSPYFRVTVRVDGPQNTASFLQAMLRPN